MRQVIDEREEELERDQETEIVIGSTGVILAAIALVAVCGLCFALGYRTGNRGSSETVAAAVPAAASAPAAPADPSHTKPSAAPQPAPEATADGSAVDASAGNDPDGNVVASSAAGANSAAATPAAQPVVQPAQSAAQAAIRPALPAQPVQSSTVAPAGSAVAPALAQSQPGTQPFMVQIAAVSHAEDANVLVNALKRRGYAVNTRRDLSDNLIHVQVGPFGNRKDAAAMQLRLLNDGYNAIVEP